MSAIVGAEGVLHPRRQTGSLVVEKQPAPAHGRLAVGARTVFYVYGVMVLNRCVGPVVPWRHTHLAAQLIDTKDGAAAVTANNV